MPVVSLESLLTSGSPENSFSNLQSWLVHNEKLSGNISPKTWSKLGQLTHLGIASTVPDADKLENASLVLQLLQRVGRSLNPLTLQQACSNGLTDMLSEVLSLAQELLSSHERVSFNTLEDFMDLLLETITGLADVSPTVKGSFINQLAVPMMEVILQLSVPCTVRLEVLKALNLLLERCPVVTKDKFQADKKVQLLMRRLAHLVLSAGDYELQVGLTEALFRLCNKRDRLEKAASWFQDPELLHAFIQVRDAHFETDCRIFLNSVNKTGPSSGRVISLPCFEVRLGDFKLEKPRDKNYSEFWLDFNVGSQRLTIFCHQQSCDELDEEDQLWETVSLWGDTISSFSCHKEGDRQEVTLQLTCPARDLISFGPTFPGSTMTIVLPTSVNIQKAIYRTFGLGDKEAFSQTRQKASIAVQPIHMSKQTTSAGKVVWKTQNSEELDNSQSQRSAHGEGRVKASIPFEPLVISMRSSKPVEVRATAKGKVSGSGQGLKTPDNRQRNPSPDSTTSHPIQTDRTPTGPQGNSNQPEKHNSSPEDPKLAIAHTNHTECVEGPIPSAKTTSAGDPSHISRTPIAASAADAQKKHKDHGPAEKGVRTPVCGPSTSSEPVRTPKFASSSASAECVKSKAISSGFASGSKSESRVGDVKQKTPLRLKNPLKIKWISKKSAGKSTAKSPVQAVQSPKQPNREKGDADSSQQPPEACVVPESQPCPVLEHTSPRLRRTEQADSHADSTTTSTPEIEDHPSHLVHGEMGDTRERYRISHSPALSTVTEESSQNSTKQKRGTTPPVLASVQEEAATEIANKSVPRIKERKTRAKQKPTEVPPPTRQLRARRAAATDSSQLTDTSVKLRQWKGRRKVGSSTPDHDQPSTEPPEAEGSQLCEAKEKDTSGNTTERKTETETLSQGSKKSILSDGDQESHKQPSSVPSDNHRKTPASPHRKPAAGKEKPAKKTTARENKKTSMSGSLDYLTKPISSSQPDPFGFDVSQELNLNESIDTVPDTCSQVSVEQQKVAERFQQKAVRHRKAQESENIKGKDVARDQETIETGIGEKDKPSTEHDDSAVGKVTTENQHKETDSASQVSEIVLPTQDEQNKSKYTMYTRGKGAKLVPASAKAKGKQSKKKDSEAGVEAVKSLSHIDVGTSKDKKAQPSVKRQETNEVKAKESKVQKDAENDQNTSCVGSTLQTPKQVTLLKEASRHDEGGTESPKPASPDTPHSQLSVELERLDAIPQQQVTNNSDVNHKHSRISSPGDSSTYFTNTGPKFFKSRGSLTKTRISEGCPSDANIYDFVVDTKEKPKPKKMNNRKSKAKGESRKTGKGKGRGKKATTIIENEDDKEAEEAGQEDVDLTVQPEKPEKAVEAERNTSISKKVKRNEVSAKEPEAEESPLSVSMVEEKSSKRTKHAGRKKHVFSETDESFETRSELSWLTSTGRRSRPQQNKTYAHYAHHVGRGRFSLYTQPATHQTFGSSPPETSPRQKELPQPGSPEAFKGEEHDEESVNQSPVKEAPKRKPAKRAPPTKAPPAIKEPSPEPESLAGPWQEESAPVSPSKSPSPSPPRKKAPVRAAAKGRGRKRGPSTPEVPPPMKEASPEREASPPSGKLVSPPSSPEWSPARARKPVGKPRKKRQKRNQENEKPSRVTPHKPEGGDELYYQPEKKKSKTAANKDNNKKTKALSERDVNTPHADAGVLSLKLFYSKSSTRPPKYTMYTPQLTAPGRMEESMEELRIEDPVSQDSPGLQLDSPVLPGTGEIMQTGESQENFDLHALSALTPGRTPRSARSTTSLQLSQLGSMNEEEVILSPVETNLDHLGSHLPSQATPAARSSWFGSGKASNTKDQQGKMGLSERDSQEDNMDKEDYEESPEEEEEQLPKNISYPEENEDMLKSGPCKRPPKRNPHRTEKEHVMEDSSDSDESQLDRSQNSTMSLLQPRKLFPDKLDDVCPLDVASSPKQQEEQEEEEDQVELIREEDLQEAATAENVDNLSGSPEELQEYTSLQMGVTALVKSFGSEIKKNILNRQHHLDQCTRSMLHATQQQMTGLWVQQQQKREERMREFREELTKELEEMEKDTAQMQKAEEEALVFIQKQHKTMQTVRKLQHDRLRKLVSLQENFTQGLREVEGQDTHHRTKLRDILKKEMENLQKKILLKTQQQELQNMRRSLHSLIC